MGHPGHTSGQEPELAQSKGSTRLGSGDALWSTEAAAAQ